MLRSKIDFKVVVYVKYIEEQYNESCDNQSQNNVESDNSNYQSKIWDP